MADNLFYKYGLNTPEEQQRIVNNCEDHTETMNDYWHTVLIVTDHIPNKLVEAQALGEPVDDYTDVLELRKLARRKLNELG